MRSAGAVRLAACVPAIERESSECAAGRLPGQPYINGTSQVRGHADPGSGEGGERSARGWTQ